MPSYSKDGAYDTEVLEVYQEDKENAQRLNYTNDANAGPMYDAARTSRLLRKLDWNIVPFLALLYL